MSEQNPYHVEVDDDGCEKCCRGITWAIDGPDELAGGTSYTRKEEAEYVAEMLNEAYRRGAASHEFRDRLECIEKKLDRLTEQGEVLMADSQLELDALKKIDDATTQIATTLTTQAGVVQSISDEVDALVTAQTAAGVPQDIIDQTNALATKAQAAAAALTAQVPTLQAIATKGAANPVPVPVPAPLPTDGSAPVA